MSLIIFGGVSVFLALVSLSVSEPLYIGLLLGVLAVSSCIVLGSGVTSLLGYFVFLIYVGGLMVLFGYVLSVFPNQKFSIGVLPLKGLFSLFIMFVVMMSHFKNLNFSDVGGFLLFDKSAFIYFFVGGFLLFVLLLVVSLCKKRHMPLRSGGCVSKLGH